MKRTICVLLALVLALPVFSMSAFAAETDDGTQKEGWVIKMGGSVSYIDENGQPAVDELETTSSFISEDELSQGNISRAFNSKMVTHVDRFCNDNVHCTLTAEFLYEVQNKVTGRAHYYHTDTYGGYQRVREYVPTITTSNDARWCRVTYKSVVLKPDDRTAICNTWIECTWAGIVTDS